MTNHNEVQNVPSDAEINALIQTHGYGHPIEVAARLNQWIRKHGGENSVSLLMYEAMKALQGDKNGPTQRPPLTVSLSPDPRGVHVAVHQGSEFVQSHPMTVPVVHDSDCALHKGPAYAAGSCDCSVSQPVVQGVPDGWKLVPVAPTHDMLCRLSGEWHPSKFGDAKERYAAVLAASPIPPASEGQESVGWLIRYLSPDGPATAYSEHNSVGDYRAEIDAAATSFPVYRHPAPQAAQVDKSLNLQGSEVDRSADLQSSKPAQDQRKPIDANDLEAMAKQRPNDKFLKGSGVLKLIAAIRLLEGQLRGIQAHSAPPAQRAPSSFVNRADILASDGPGTVVRKLDAAFHDAVTFAAKPAQYEREALRALIRAYVNLMESGRDRITDLGGQCDPVDVMEASDPALREARAALSTPPMGGDAQDRIYVDAGHLREVLNGNDMLIHASSELDPLAAGRLVELRTVAIAAMGGEHGSV